MRPLRPIHVFLFFALALASACVAVRGPGATPTPQRPSFSSDTSTTAEGTLELEAGVVSDPGDGGELPVTMKYGSGPRTEVFLGGAPLRWVENGDDEFGLGDLVVGVRHRIREEEPGLSSLALSGSIKLPTGSRSRGLGSGDVDASFALAAARAVDELTLVAYGQVDVVGQPQDDAALGADLAFLVGHPLDASTGAFVELAGLLLPEEDFSELLLTAGLSHALDPATVLDLALQVGFGDDGRDPALLLGLTSNLGAATARRGPRSSAEHP